MTVLVVEDNPAVLRSNTKLFEQRWFDVLPAVNSMEAFDRLRGSVLIHAIFCDIDMLTLNGTGFFEQLEEILPGLGPTRPVPCRRVNYGFRESLISNGAHS